MNASERRGSSAADDTAFAREGKMNKNLLESCVGCLFFFDAGVVLISFFIYFKLAPHLPDAVRHKLSNVRVRSVLTVSHTDTQFPCEYHGIKRRTQSQVERQKQRKRKTNRVSRIHKNVVSNCVHCAHCACLSFYGVLRGAKGNPVHFICFHLLLLCLFVFRGSRHLIYFSYYFYWGTEDENKTILFKFTDYGAGEWECIALCVVDICSGTWWFDTFMLFLSPISRFYIVAH